MLNFSNILGSRPLCCSRFTAVLNQGSFEQLSKNDDVNAGNKKLQWKKLNEQFSRHIIFFITTKWNAVSSKPNKTQEFQNWIEVSFYEIKTAGPSLATKH